MKIVDILTKEVKFTRRKVFKVAYSAGSLYSTRVYVKLVTDEGICGLGEASPSAMVAGETIKGVITTIEHYLKPALIGMDPCDIEAIHKKMESVILRNPAAKAAIDIACYDIMGKKAGMPVHKLLGAKEDSFQIDFTIGIDTVEAMAKDALEWAEKGFRILKVKIGNEPDKDIEAIKAIRRAVGDKIDIRVDANQGYDIDTAMRVFTEIKKLGVFEAEQPLPFYDIHGMAELKKISPITLMADEGVHTPVEAEIACQHDACDIINIKLMKCGGIYPALKISEIAKKYGKTCIVGCMSESKLAIAAAAAVRVAKDNVVDADLDSFLAFINPELGVTGGFAVDKDVITLSDKPGLGFDDYEF